MSIAKRAVTRYLAYVNEHNVGAALDCLAETFELWFSGSDYVMSKDAAADALAWDAGVGGRLEWRVVSADVRHVTIEGLETNEFLSLIGVGNLAFRSRFDVSEGGKIERQLHQVDWGAVTLEAAMEPLIDWASQQEPDELAEIYPDGRMLYTRRMGERSVALARRWRGRPGA